MPNWCSNGIIIRGKSLEDFKKTLHTKTSHDEVLPFSFSQTIPKPINEKDVYAWNLQNWGTKWDCKESYISEKDNFIHIYCETAWSPPIEWAKNCLKKFEDISIEIGYCESGMEFFGSWKNNESTHFSFEEDDFSYDKIAENFIYSQRLQDHLEKYSIDVGG